MVGVDWLSRRVSRRIRERWCVVHDRSRLARWGLGNYERLDVKAPHETLVSFPLVIALDVALIPGQAKGAIGNLDDKEIEFRIGRQALCINSQLLDRPQGDDPYVCADVREAIAVFGRGGTHHFEPDRVFLGRLLGGCDGLCRPSKGHPKGHEYGKGP